MEHKLGLDQPLAVQYLHWLKRFVVGDWGVSYIKGQPVFEMIIQKLPATYSLAVASMVLAIFTSLPLGIIAAVKQNTGLDYIAMILALLGISIPAFWMGIMLILVFALKLRWLPSIGFVSPIEDPFGALRHLILPSIALGTAMTGTFTRMIRSSLLEVMGEDYVRTARAKGLSERGVIFVHALKNAIIPTLTVVGMWFGFLLAGSVVIETIFAWPGVGQLLVHSILNRDYPVVQNVVLIVAISVVLVNLVVDIVYTLLDPRIRLS
ncbi:MAG: Glutathione transport system permease protein GsiC [Anaerolineales bacterium]|nr:Glutathione transport system permease protein GsiC [Anaerolineales bacterium]